MFMYNIHLYLQQTYKQTKGTLYECILIFGCMNVHKPIYVYLYIIYIQK